MYSTVVIHLYNLQSDFPWLINGLIFLRIVFKWRILGYSFGTHNVFSFLSAISHLVKNPFSSRELLWSQFPEIEFKFPKGYFHSTDDNTEPWPQRVTLHLYSIHTSFLPLHKMIAVLSIVECCSTMAFSCWTSWLVSFPIIWWNCSPKRNWYLLSCWIQWPFPGPCLTYLT